MTRHTRPRPLVRRPTVSVVIPCYNYGHYLPGAVRSALDQDGVDVQAIVIDDASPDGSAAVAVELARAEPRITLLCHEQNKGHIATYNEGLAMVESDYVVLLSADDLLVPGSLARATALMEANSSVGYVYGHPVDFSDVPPDVPTDVKSWSIWSGSEWIRKRSQRGKNCIYCPEVVMRNSVQQTIGGYDPALPHSGDFEMWLRAAAVADVGRVNGPCQALYRVHDGSMQRTTYAGHLTDLEGRRAAFASVLLSTTQPMPGGPALYAEACRALAVDALDRACADHDYGTATPEGDEQLLAFAARIYPGAQSLRGWKALHRRMAPPAVPPAAMTAACHRLARDLNWRIQGRRWRWSGV
jgi:hypothetical protein